MSLSHVTQRVTATPFFSRPVSREQQFVDNLIEKERTAYQNFKQGSNPSFHLGMLEVLKSIRELAERTYNIVIDEPILYDVANREYMTSNSARIA